MSTQPQPEGSQLPSPPRPLPALTLASSEGGSGVHPFFKIGAALIIAVLGVGGYVYFNEKPPVVAGEILHLTAYPIHRESKASQYAVQSTAAVETTFDQVIIVADVRLKNQSEGPLFLADMAASLKLPTEVDRSLAANATDYGRVFIAYPQLAPIRQQPLLRNITIPAGSTAEGQLVFNYPIPKEVWDQRESLNLVLSFTHQKDVVLQAPQ